MRAFRVYGKPHSLLAKYAIDEDVSNRNKFSSPTVHCYIVRILSESKIILIILHYNGLYSLKNELSWLARTLGLWVRIPFEAWMSVSAYSVSVSFNVWVEALWRADLPSKESYRLCIVSRNWKNDKGPTKGCRTMIIIQKTEVPSLYLLHSDFLFGLLDDPKDGGNIFLQKFGSLSTDYTALIPEVTILNNQSCDILRPYNNTQMSRCLQY
jgi:hypothetical protein